MAEPTTSMLLASIRRYPVKSMGGEYLDTVELDGRGIVGDRWFAVEDIDGLFASGKDTRRFRRRDAVFDYAASTTDAGVQVRGAGGAWLVGDRDLDAVLSAQMSAAVRVLPEGAVPHQDAAAVSLIGTASLAWCAQRWDIEADPRRLRVNLVISTDEPFVEESWVGRRVSLGEAVLDLTERVERCRMIDLDQDGVDARGRWLKQLGEERDVCIAVYATVAQQGPISVGDSVRVL